MLAKVYSCAVIGLDAAIVEVEVDTANGLPSFVVVGSDSQCRSPLSGTVGKDTKPDQKCLKPSLMRSHRQSGLEDGNVP